MRVCPGCTVRQFQLESGWLYTHSAADDDGPLRIHLKGLSRRATGARTGPGRRATIERAYRAAHVALDASSRNEWFSPFIPTDCRTRPLAESSWANDASSSGVVVIDDLHALATCLPDGGA